MREQFRKMWGYYIALILIIVILAFPIGWIYQIALTSWGTQAADLVLVVTIIVVLGFAIRGAVHASRIEGTLTGQVMALQHPPKPGSTVEPFEFKVLGLVLFRYPETSFEFKVADTDDEEYKLLPETPNRTRIKQKNFPEERIRKAVLKWERRDRSFCARNLEEFLEQEFGNMDGVPSMATSTFYEHRTRILKEIKEKQESSQG